jgi:DNA-binding NtrC family response regulator
MNPAKVLCVENNADYQDALRRLLEIAGYEVIAAKTGIQALELFTTESFCGVLLEHDLPDATGAAVRTEMKWIKPDVPVLLFAGVSDQTPFLLRFFDSYIRADDKNEAVLRELDS